MNKKQTGNEGEDRVVAYLRQQGYTIVDRNYYSRHGEIDIIASRNGYICFVEVKYRRKRTSGLPEESVTLTKMKRICKTASLYLYTHKQFAAYQPRFDVAALEDQQLRYYENAFPYLLENSY